MLLTVPGVRANVPRASCVREHAEIEPIVQDESRGGRLGADSVYLRSVSAIRSWLLRTELSTPLASFHKTEVSPPVGEARVGLPEKDLRVALLGISTSRECLTVS